MTHELKIFERYANRIIAGEKTFELRCNDRDYQTGDKVHFYKVISEGPCPNLPHKISDNIYSITYVLQDIDGLRPGYCIFGIKLETSEDKDNDKHE